MLQIFRCFMFSSFQVLEVSKMAIKIFENIFERVLKLKINSDERKGCKEMCVEIWKERA